MKISIDSIPPHQQRLWRVFDHRDKTIRYDVLWADDMTATIGVCGCGLGIGNKSPFSTLFACGSPTIEKRERVLIITSARWIAIDTPIDRPREKVIDGVPVHLHRRGVRKKPESVR